MNNNYSFDYCLIGNPVKHSFSPLIHNSITELIGLEGVYGLNQVDYNLEAEIKALYDSHIRGINITVPYKSDVMKCIARVDDIAAAIGAVNTLVWTENGYEGYNTDYKGLSRELDDEGIELEGNNVLLIGAGGAARAAAFLAALKNCKSITIINRTASKAEIICNDIKNFFKDKSPKLRVIGYDQLAELKGEKYIVFQCTKVGMHPDIDNCAIADEDFYSIVEYGIDLIYTPDKTAFMLNCEKAGAHAYNGLKMLLYQAVEAYEMWHNVVVSKDVIDEVYKRLRTRTKHSVVLVGCMGAGKSVIGRKLASNYDMELIDTDIKIEKNENMKISHIFETKGEAYFRQLEHDCIEALANTDAKIIISVGGGLPIREDNRAALKRAGVVVYLRAKASTLAKRLVHDNDRPLLKNGKSEDKIQSLLDVRGAIYEEVADYIIDTDDMSLDDIVKKVGRLI